MVSIGSTGSAEESPVRGDIGRTPRFLRSSLRSGRDIVPHGIEVRNRLTIGRSTSVVAAEGPPSLHVLDGLAVEPKVLEHLVVVFAKLGRR